LNQLGGAAAVLIRKRRPGKVDTHLRERSGDLAYSSVVRPESRADDVVARGHAPGKDGAGLESFPNPGVAQIAMTSDELTAVCPLTDQPDLYTATIEYRPARLCLESKSLKLYLARFRNEEALCETLAVQIRDDVAAALELDAQDVRVTLRQKARGGITITAIA
jgi:7-cyano-7-deazaguanine reductase